VELLVIFFGDSVSGLYFLRCELEVMIAASYYDRNLYIARD
jgi:hypothetical protein